MIFVLKKILVQNVDYRIKELALLSSLEVLGIYVPSYHEVLLSLALGDPYTVEEFSDMPLCIVQMLFSIWAVQFAVLRLLTLPMH